MVDVAADLRASLRAPLPDAVCLWWLGQAGVLVQGPSASIVIDPFLTDYGSFGRTYPPPLAPTELGGIDLLLGTHDHIDHIDPLGFAQIHAVSAATVVVPAPVVARVHQLGIDPDRVVAAHVDRPIVVGGARVTAIPAAHAMTPDDGYGFHTDEQGQHPFVGYLLEVDGARICHTGDTLVYDGLDARLSAMDLDVLLVPINGRSRFREERGLVGNLNTFEAAELAARSGARLTIPIHWDLFRDNQEDPEHFRRYTTERYPEVHVHIPTLCARLPLPARPGDGT